MSAPRTELAARLATYDRLVEVGIGRRPEVAAALVDAGCDVTATDVFDAPVPEGVRLVRDDVVERAEGLDGHPLPDHYRVDAVYGLNLPAELQSPARDVARAAGADFLFTTLGFEEPVIPVACETVGTETLYVAERRR
ncbi:hypothetical protein DU500_05455 [Haloplanus rubicundus]|uniref:Uncharacterized protein n=1 Tax=Haloplanus rubicundus TaxID=1547898 RepID=A0A345E159_9EURY|nr:UPF0146 family protein [Haloplanus rubicundus]AXG05931.1 hypothetical protein DU500_05455 [Haloplanus rubicundus]